MKVISGRLLFRSSASKLLYAENYQDKSLKLHNSGDLHRTYFSKIRHAVICLFVFQRNESIKSSCLVLKMSQSFQVINPVSIFFNMAVKHCCIGGNPCLWAVSCISSQFSDEVFSRQIIFLSSSSNISAPPPGIESRPQSLRYLILHRVKVLHDLSCNQAQLPKRLLHEAGPVILYLSYEVTPVMKIV